MSNYGFVYLLGNRAMPCHYKIGCTERAPHARAKELSRASGVPHPFHVLLYIEVPDFQRVESRFHQEMSDFRANHEREFFCFGPAHMNWLWHVFENFPRVASFAAPCWSRYAARPQFPDDYAETWVDNGEYLCLPDHAPLDGPDLELAIKSEMDRLEGAL
jgi:hypothetical protein